MGVLSDVDTIECVAPKLPEKIIVQWNNGMTTTEDIVWNEINESAYKIPKKSFTVKGSLNNITGTDGVVSVIVNVKAKTLMSLSWKDLSDGDEQQNNPSGTVFYGNYDWTKINGTLVAKYNNNTLEEIDIHDERVIVSGFDPESEAATQSVSLSYTYGEESEAITKKLSFLISRHRPQKLIITKPSKTTYVVGQKFDPTGLSVITVYDDDTEIDPNKGKDVPTYSITGFDSTTASKRTLTISQDGLNETFEVEIIQKTAIKISVSDIHPQKIGMELDTTGVMATVLFNDGEAKDMNLTDLIDDNQVEILNYDKEKLGRQTIKIKYGRVSCYAEIIVKDKVVTKIQITDNPEKYEYIEGTELDLTGGMLRITYDNDTYDDVDIVKEMVTGFDKNKIGIQVIEVSVDGKSDSFSVNVKAKQIVTR